MGHSGNTVAAVALVLICAVSGEIAHAGPAWKLADRVAEVEMTRGAEILGVRYDGEEEFTPVEQGVVPSLVEGQSFYARDLPLAAYLVEGSSRQLMLWNPWWCRMMLKSVDQLTGLIFIELPQDLDGTMRIKYPDGQTVTISGRGEEVDYSQGPELLTFWLKNEPVSGVDFRGFRRFTLLEFFDQNTGSVTSRNVVTEVPFE